MLNIQEPSKTTDTHANLVSHQENSALSREPKTGAQPARRRSPCFLSGYPVSTRPQIRWADDADVAITPDANPSPVQAALRTNDNSEIWQKETRSIASYTRPILAVTLALVVSGTALSFYLARSPSKSNVVAASSQTSLETEVQRVVSQAPAAEPETEASSSVATASSIDRFGDIFGVVSATSAQTEEQLRLQALAKAYQVQSTPLTTASIGKQAQPSSQVALGFTQASAPSPSFPEVETTEKTSRPVIETKPAAEVVKPVSISGGASGTIVSSVNMRESAENGASVLTVVPGGSSVGVNSCDSWWCSITYEGATGYVAKRFVEQNG